MKRFFTTCKVIMVTMVLAMMSTNVQAQEVQGWPANYNGVMLQGFFWDSYSKSKWTKLTEQADELCQYFNLIWIPQSGKADANPSMGYDPKYWFPDGNVMSYASSFGNEQELRDMIKAFKDRGTGTIADVVVNHRANFSNWVDFPAETYKGVTYQLQSTDIVNDDDGGDTKAHTGGLSLSSNGEGQDWATGKDCEGFNGLRDLDHQSTNVQNNVKAYVKMLKEDLGYVGFRYDMVKGYPAYYTGMYNTAAGVEYSVGEFWDGTQAIRNWIDGAKVNGWPTTAAFDFQFRYTVRNAANNSNWANLNAQNDGNWPLMSDNYDSGNYRRWAITFVENHDVQDRGTTVNYNPDPIKKDTLAANAYLLAMPGTPCVFLTHWMDCKQDIKSMIDVRKKAGIHSQSKYKLTPYGTNYCKVYSGEEDNYNNHNLLAVVGKYPSTFSNTGFVKVLEGYHYAYFLNTSMNTAWVDRSSGKYKEAFDVMVSAVSSNTTQLVYTTNGTNPTASSTKIASGGKIKISTFPTTLKVGLLINGAVSGIVTRTYEKEEDEVFVLPDFVHGQEGTFAYFEAPSNWKSPINVWAWNASITEGSIYKTKWPGTVSQKDITLEGTNNGKNVYLWKNSTQYTPTMIIFNDGSNQTADLDFVNGGYYTDDGCQAVVSTGIETITTQPEQKVDNRWYSISGQVLNGQPTQKGIYINNGHKVVIK